jgi:dihydrofolate reductase
MRKLTTLTHVTLDGVMQAPGGPEEDPRNGFTHGGWAMSRSDDAVRRDVLDLVSGEFDLLLGGWTYRLFASHWPQQSDHPIANAFNRATKYVVTRRAAPLPWEPSRRLTGDIVDEIRRLKATEGPPLHVWGSSELLQTLTAADLVDEYRLWIFPLVLGGGKRLFEKGVPPRRLTLVDSRSTPAGVLINTYRPERGA